MQFWIEIFRWSRIETGLPDFLNMCQFMLHNKQGIFIVKSIKYVQYYFSYSDYDKYCGVFSRSVF